MKTRLLLPVAVLPLLCCFSGCQSASVITREDVAQLKGYETKLTNLETNLATTNTKLAAVTDTLITKLDEKIVLRDDKSRFAAQYVFAAHRAMAEEPQPNRRALFITGELTNAISMLPAVTESMRGEAMERLRLALSEAEADRALLAERYRVLNQQKLALETKSAELDTEVKTLTDQKGQLVGTQQQIKDEMSAVKDDALKKSKEIIVKQQEAAQESKASDQRKAVIARWLLFAGIGVGLLAAFSVQFYPPVTVPLGAAAVGFIVAAWAVVSVPTWVLVVILLFSVAAIAAACYIRYFRTRQIADNSMGAIEQLKNAARDGDATASTAYQRLRTELEDWFGSATDNGLHQEMHTRLKKLNVIGRANAAPIPAVPAVAK